MNGPKLMCAVCGEVEVGIYSPVCESCAVTTPPPAPAAEQGVACGKCGVRQPLQHSPDCGRTQPEARGVEGMMLTDEMNEAGEREIAFGNDFQDAWNAALAAAPEPVRVDDRAVARVQRGPAPHDQLYAMLLPGVDESRVQPGDVLFLRPLLVEDAMVERGAALSTSGRKDDPVYRAKIRVILEAALANQEPPHDH